MTTIAALAVDDPKAVESLALQWGKAWNDHDGEAVAAMCTEDLVYDEPALGDTVHGRDSIRDFVQRTAVAYPDYYFRLETLSAGLHGRTVLVAWRMTGTRAGTDRTIDLHGDDRLTINEAGLISAYRCIYDHALLTQQLGGLPALP